MRPVIGLDLSLSSTGVVVFRDGKMSGSGALQWAEQGERMSKAGKSKSLSDRQRIERLGWIRDQVQSIADTLLQIDKPLLAKDGPVFGIEGYAFSRHSSSVTGLAELGGVIRVMIQEKYNTTPIALSVTACRKFVVGSGKVSKDEARAWLVKQGFAFETDDEADAYIVGLTTHYLVNDHARQPLDVTRLEIIDGISRDVERRIPREHL